MRCSVRAGVVFAVVLLLLARMCGDARAGDYVAAATGTEQAGATATATGSRAISRAALEETLFEVISLLERGYYKEYTLDEAALDGAVKGLLSALGEPYTRYSAPGKSLGRVDEDLESYGGLGVLVDYTPGGVTVFRVIPGSAAEKNGIRPGDVLTRVDGKDVTGLDRAGVSRALIGEIGAMVKVTVRRGGEKGEEVDVELARGLVQVDYVEGKMLPGGIGLLRIMQFGDSAASQVSAELEKLRAAGAEAVLVDLRNNPGGLLMSGVEIADMFLESGPIFTLRERDVKNDTVFAAHAENTIVRVPYYALVNHYTASCAELLAAALKYGGGAVVLGETTWGKALSQHPEALGNGGVLWVTSGSVLAHGDVDINKAGLAPDVEIKEEPGVEEKKAGGKELTQAEVEALPDPVLDRAAEYVRNELLKKKSAAGK